MDNTVKIMLKIPVASIRKARTPKGLKVMLIVAAMAMFIPDMFSKPVIKAGETRGFPKIEKRSPEITSKLLPIMNSL